MSALLHVYKGLSHINNWLVYGTHSCAWLKYQLDLACIPV